MLDSNYFVIYGNTLCSYGKRVAAGTGVGIQGGTARGRVSHGWASSWGHLTGGQGGLVMGRNISHRRESSQDV